LSQPFSQEDLNDAEEIDFDVEKEDWNIYHLKDGTTLKVKLVLSGVKRLKKYGQTVHQYTL
jgi:hypothetical protein